MTLYCYLCNAQLQHHNFKFSMFQEFQLSPNVSPKNILVLKFNPLKQLFQSKEELQLTNMIKMSIVLSYTLCGHSPPSDWAQIGLYAHTRYYKTIIQSEIHLYFKGQIAPNTPALSSRKNGIHLHSHNLHLHFSNLSHQPSQLACRFFPVALHDHH